MWNAGFCTHTWTPITTTSSLDWAWKGSPPTPSAVHCEAAVEDAGIHHTHQGRMCSSLHIFSSLVDPMNMWGVILSYAGCSKASKPNYCAASSQGRQMVACFCVPALPVVWLIYSSLIFLSPLLPFFVLYFYWKIYMKSTILNHF